MESDNEALSEARAEAVHRYLIAQGVPADRLDAAGFGESRPLEREGTPDAWYQNRRVDGRAPSLRPLGGPQAA
jgi:chemotaxis protein MotB